MGYTFGSMTLPNAAGIESNRAPAIKPTFPSRPTPGRVHRSNPAQATPHDRPRMARTRIEHLFRKE
jgi:hypothetical protein